MQITRSIDLAALSNDTLGVAYGRFNAQTLAATSRVGLGRALAARERVGDQVSRRGLLIRRSYTGDYMVGRPADFEPCQ